MPDRIPLDLQRRFLFHLSRKWATFNADHLDGQLKTPQFALDESTTRLGRWDPLTRTIGISIEHLLEATWLEIELTLRHEMAHQFVSEVFDGKGRPHGVLFQRACRMLQISASPRAERTPSEASRRAMEKVRKLLNLAGSDNPHEAQAAMAAANKLLLLHNLDELDAKADPGFSWRWIGAPTGRVTLERKLISGILISHYFVRAVWMRTTMPITGKQASVLEVLGRPHNLDLAQYVHTYLDRTLDTLWKRYKKATGAKGNAVRNEYRVGVLMGFRDHLKSQTQQHQEQGLIWTGDPGLQEFVRERFPRLVSMRRSSYRVGTAHDRGREDGRQIRIRPGVNGVDSQPSTSSTVRGLLDR